MLAKVIYEEVEINLTKIVSWKLLVQLVNLDLPQTSHSRFEQYI